MTKKLGYDLDRPDLKILNQKFQFSAKDLKLFGGFCVIFW